ncbi:MAG TPA: hypothetical protein VMA09_22060 [Candidatus Binataceae bacterium]|nr:hypothetical protein [Candidatus Binataceae bacterium]
MADLLQQLAQLKRLRLCCQLVQDAAAGALRLAHQVEKTLELGVHR